MYIGFIGLAITVWQDSTSSMKKSPFKKYNNEHLGKQIAKSLRKERGTAILQPKHLRPTGLRSDWSLWPVCCCVGRRDHHPKLRIVPSRVGRTSPSLSAAFVGRRQRDLRWRRAVGRG